MFVQIIIGDTDDAEGVRRQLDRWAADLAPGATGWLGATAGKSTQGPLCMVARFESEEAARANSDRPEQGEWWKDTEALFTGPVRFIDSVDVGQFWSGGSDDAGFVQLMRARISDRERLEQIEDEVDDLMRQWRSDIIGGLRVWEAGGHMTAVDYFTSETEARAAEKSELPEGLGEKFEEWQGLSSDTEWYDLSDPWLWSP